MDLFSGNPYWPIKDGLLETYPPLEDDISCDVAIIGGGITGACVSYELTRAGFKVVVLDRRDIGSGSTAGSTSLLQYELDTPFADLADRIGEERAARVHRLCAAAVKRIGEFAAEVSHGCTYREQETVYGASRLGDVPGLRREYELHRKHGFQVRFWDRAQVKKHSSLPFHAALLCRPSAQVDAYALTYGLHQAAVKRGARVFDRTRVTGRELAGRGVVLRTDRGSRVKARRVVVAAGYEAESFLRERATQLQTTFALVTEPLRAFPGWPGNRLIWETARPYFYLRKTDDNRIIFGGADEPFTSPTRREQVLPAKVRQLVRRFQGWFPEIPIEVAYSWAGTFAVTKDGLPFIGEHRRFPRTYFALGYGGNGITFSVVAAGIIRDLCRGRTNADADLFRFGR